MMLLPMVEEPPQQFTDGHGRRWLRTGFCSRCGACCVGCHNLIQDGGLAVCADYGGEQYRSYGCHTFPSDGDCARMLPECTYVFRLLDPIGGAP